MGKVTKSSVDYRPAEDFIRRCGSCAMYQPGIHECTHVEGTIKSGATCNDWNFWRSK